MIRCTRFAILAEVDASDWASETLFSIDGQNVTGAATARFPTPLAMLGGRGMMANRTLQQELDAEGTGAGAWTVGIDPVTDKLWIEYEGGGGLGSFQLTVVGADAEAYGFGVAGTVVISTDMGGGVHRVDATYTPRIGTITNAHLSIDPADGVAFVVPSIPYRQQSIWTLLRSASGGGSPDADQTNAADSLAYRTALLDTDPTGGRIGAGMTDDGRTWISWPSDIGGTGIVWVNHPLRKFLGFRGDEATVATVGNRGTVKIIESVGPCLGGLVTSRQLRAAVTFGHTEEGHSHRMWNGELAGTAWGTRKSVSLPFYLDGPNDTLDLHRHWLGDRDNPGFLGHAPRNTYMEAFLRWGDTRRAQGTAAPSYASGAWVRPPYSTLWTARNNGLAGRIICRRSGDDEAEKSVTFDQRMRRFEASILLELAEAGAHEP